MYSDYEKMEQSNHFDDQNCKMQTHMEKQENNIPKSLISWKGHIL
jgi:hypothetical protein